MRRDRGWRRKAPPDRSPGPGANGLARLVAVPCCLEREPEMLVPRLWAAGLGCDSYRHGPTWSFVPSPPLRAERARRGHSPFCVHLIEPGWAIAPFIALMLMAWSNRTKTN